jgi:ATP-dependent Clp protease ATP-binding subunit ClpC
MFERFSKNARRAIFFARKEALQSGSSQIEAVDLLFGLLQ